MADDFWEVPSEIDILLGADIFPKILFNGLFKGPFGTPIAQRTIIWWIISRPIAKLSKSTSPITAAHT